ncbi:hypothetical protein [Sporosarcina sp. USHLN248]|uniref:hypothetical protein n=1 Tax=Sporosarcina sp. USHLN248 TaxID=3081300 RepID=UPI0030169C06
MIYFIMPAVVALIGTLILSLVFKNSSKADKGVELNYFKLSYRRKMIRTLANIPIIILLLIVLYSFSNWSTLGNTLIGLFFVFLFLIQIVYNFFMWKRNEA